MDVAWSAVLLAASVAAVVPLARRGAWVAVAFFAPILIGISAGGNVHALLIASLVWTVERRSGPVWIGVAASLKLFPILFALTYLGRRQWWRAGATVAITAVLLAPYLLYDLTNYVTTAGGAAFWSGRWSTRWRWAGNTAALVAGADPARLAGVERGGGAGPAAVVPVRRDLGHGRRARRSGERDERAIHRATGRPVASLGSPVPSGTTLYRRGAHCVGEPRRDHVNR